MWNTCALVETSHHCPWSELTIASPLARGFAKRFRAFVFWWVPQLGSALWTECCSMSRVEWEQPPRVEWNGNVTTSSKSRSRRGRSSVCARIELPGSWSLMLVRCPFDQALWQQARGVMFWATGFLLVPNKWGQNLTLHASPKVPKARAAARLVR